MTELTLAALCERLEDLLASGGSLTVVAAICETGAHPELVREAFQNLQARGKARLVGGQNRGWSLVRRGSP